MNEASRRVQAEYERLGPCYGVRSALNAFGHGPSEQHTLEALLGDAHGLAILDAACAGGRLSGWLADRGARVTGLDLTMAMLRAAQAQYGGRARFVQADLAQPLPFATGSFDVVLSAFTLHYLRDWAGALREMHRLLRPDGALVFSVHHPSNDLQFAAGAGYFQVAEAGDTWIASDGSPAEVHFFRRPLTLMGEALFRAGFAIERLLEAPPEQLPLLSADQTPFFLCVRAFRR